MSDIHYYDENGEKTGPVTLKELATLAHQGMVTPETPIETECGHHGIAGEISGLFDTDDTETPTPFHDQPDTECCNGE